MVDRPCRRDVLRLAGAGLASGLTGCFGDFGGETRTATPTTVTETDTDTPYPPPSGPEPPEVPRAFSDCPLTGSAEPPTAEPISRGNWPTYRGDPGNTGTSPGATGSVIEEGKRFDAEIFHEFYYDGSAMQAPIVVEETLYWGHYRGVVVAFDVTDGSERWHFGTGARIPGPPAVAGKTVYVANDGGRVYALDREDGGPRWCLDVGGEPTPSPVRAANGFVYVPVRHGSEEGDPDYAVHAVDAETGTEQWRFDGGPADRSSVAVDEDTVYVPTLGGLSAIDATRGTLRWQGGPKGSHAHAAVRNGTVYVVGNYTVEALSAADGTVRWKYGPENFPTMPPTVTPDRILVVMGRDGPLTAFSTENGSVEWTWGEQSDVHLPPVAGDDAVYAFTPTSVNELDPETGEQRASAELAVNPVEKGALALGDGRFYVVGMGIDRARIASIW